MGEDALRAEIEREFVVEREGWVVERTTRVDERLQPGVPAAERLHTLVLWSEAHTAFTGPGRTIYFSRRLLERMADDDATAMVVAHELAHHRLGHVPALPRGWLLLPVRLAIAYLQQRIAGADHERDADLLGIELCLDAGYDPERCVAAFEHMANVVVDYGDIEGWLGRPGWTRRHPPLAERIAAVRAHVEAVRRGHRRLAPAAAVGGAAVAAALFVLRRRR